MLLRGPELPSCSKDEPEGTVRDLQPVGCPEFGLSGAQRVGEEHPSFAKVLQHQVPLTGKMSNRIHPREGSQVGTRKKGQGGRERTGQAS